MSVQDKVAKYVDRAINVAVFKWLAVTALLTASAIFLGSLLALAGAALLSGFIYPFFIRSAIRRAIDSAPRFIQSFSEEELDELERDALAEEGKELVQILNMADTYACRYMDMDIPAWVEFKHDDEVRRFEFDRIAQKDEGGNPIIPIEEGKEFVVVAGVAYSRAVQPAQS